MKVEGLTYSELRHLSERLGEQAERQAETAAEFSVPTWSLLNSLEGLGYRVMHAIFIQKMWEKKTTSSWDLTLSVVLYNISCRGCDFWSWTMTW